MSSETLHLLQPRKTGRIWTALPKITVWLTCLFAIVGGAITLIGWAIPAPRLTDWAGKGISMFPNAAVCGILAALAILLVAKGPDKFRGVGKVLAAIAGTIGALTLFQHLTDVNLGIDEALFKGTWGQMAANSPMRIGVPASTSFFLLGIGIFLSADGPRGRRAASILAVVPIAIASLSLTGYLFGANQLFGIARYTGISWQTATIVSALGIGLIASLPQNGLMALLGRDDASGVVSRRMIFPIIAIPFLLGWLTAFGRDMGVFDADFGTSIRTLVEVTLFLGFLWWTSNSIREQAAQTAAATEALRKSEERFAIFMRSLPGFAWIKNPDGKYIYVNESTSGLLRGDENDFLGYSDREIFPAEIAAAYEANDRLALSQPTGVQAVETIVEVTGSHRSVLVSKFPIPNPNGDGMLIGGIGVDITDRLRAERALVEAHQRKDEFLATLAHELRNPLAPIRYSVELLKMELPQVENVRVVLDIMERQVQHMARLLDDLLDVSRILYGKLTIRPESVTLSSVLEHAMQTSGPLLESGGQKLEIRLPDENVNLQGDPVRLAQVFANLLNNAARHTPAGTTVKVTANLLDGQVVVVVEDDGPGIPDDVLDRIFDTFSQGSSGKTGAQSGLGIGLSLVRGIVDLHKGSVEVFNNQPAPGCRFVLTLPAAAKGAVAPGTPPPTLNKTQESMRILVADDLRDGADTVAAYLRSEGHAVRTAYDGEAAFRVARDFQPQIALLDIGMPGLTGHEVCKAIRAEPWGEQMLLVAVTGWGQPSDRQQAAEVGFDHHLVKPVDLHRLDEIIAAGKP